jgi:hypothetical protein
MLMRDAGCGDVFFPAAYVPQSALSPKCTDDSSAVQQFAPFVRKSSGLETALATLVGLGIPAT